MSLKRLLTVLLLLVSLSGAAATTAERSPFTQGLWWNPSTPGHGFDVFNVGNDVSILWYTYDASGRPTWYAAQGALDAKKTATLPLVQYRWANGQRTAATNAGTIRLEIFNPERMTATWTLGATQGTSTLVPFTVSGTITEIDHTGTWFDPRASGWGLSFIEQGDVTGGILFTYDTAGAPTWLAGFGRDGRSVEMFTYAGTCPSCTYRASTSSSVGRLAYDFDQEWQITLHGMMAAPMPAGVSVDSARMFQLGRPASARTADRQLASFTNEAALKDYIVSAYPNITSGPAIGFSASPPVAAFSTTNLQESGVDEADLVKSDGQYIYTFAADNGVRKPTLRIAQVGTEGSSLAMRGTYALTGGATIPLNHAGLYLDGTTLVALTGSAPTVELGVVLSWYGVGSWSSAAMNIEVMSLANATSPSTTWRAQIDGNLVSSRRIGNKVYIVSRFVPTLGLQPSGVPIAELLPKIRVNGGDPTPLVDPSQVYLPPQGERPYVADFIFVIAIDIAQPRVSQVLAVAGTAETVYASTQNLYVATTRTAYRALSGTLLAAEPAFVTTDIHQIRLGDAGMSIVGSGTVEGYLGNDPDKSAFRLGEYDGRLRAVSSSNGLWGAQGKNRLTVLEPSKVQAGLLKTISVLPNTQRPDPIGKPGELLYATRFVGDRLYAVTFKQVDPLYVVDVSNAADPKIAGAVELPGFSDYLHPLSNGLLLGFGKDACPATTVADGTFSWYQGLQVALFDVANPNQPRRLTSLAMGKRGSSSALLTSHHAFSSLVQPDGSTAIAIPGRLHDGAPVSGGIIGGGTADCNGTFYAWKESGLMRFEVRGTSSGAQLTQLPGLVTHSAATTGTLVYDAASDGGRSIIFRNGVVYVGNGQFWRLDNTGSSTGPF